MEMPPLSALQSAVEELHRTLADAKQTQREIFEVTGTAWSEDRFVKAVVGPRGQLVELELDPRIYRRPNSTALAATIVATVRAAADQAIAKTQEILDRKLPAELRNRPGRGMDMRRLMRSHDADLKKTLDEEGDDVDLR